MNAQNNIPENITPFGISTTHFDKLFISKNNLWLKELGYKNLAATLQGQQDTMDKAMREMLQDGGRESRIGKTQLLAKMSEAFKKEMLSITNGQLKLAGKQINTLSEIGERMPGNTSENSEIREILRTRDFSQGRLIEMAREDKALTCALLSSPHIKLAYGFNDKQMGELETINLEFNLGEENHQLLKDAIQLHDVVTNARNTMSAKYDQCIKIANDNSYGSSSAIVKAAIDKAATT